MQQYEFHKEGEQVMGRELKTGKEFPLVFFHFHAFLCYRRKWMREFYAEGYELPKSVRLLIYKPYFKDYKIAYLLIRKINSMVDGMASRPHEIQSDWKYLKRIRHRILDGENKYFYWLFH